MSGWASVALPTGVLVAAVVWGTALRYPMHPTRRVWGWANHVTLARGVLLTALAGFLVAPQPQPGLCGIIYAIAVIGDGLDGWLARRRGQVSRFGQILIVFGIWAFQVPFSAWWLARFRFGPFEWLWRTLAYMKLQPMTR